MLKIIKVEVMVKIYQVKLAKLNGKLSAKC